jgi:hypothetical protein
MLDVYYNCYQISSECYRLHLSFCYILLYPIIAYWSQQESLFLNYLIVVLFMCNKLNHSVSNNILIMTNESEREEIKDETHELEDEDQDELEESDDLDDEE